MSFVGEPYDHDYFISYSHGAFVGVEDSNLKIWSVAFAELLERELRSYPKLQHDLKVFRDQDWRSNQAIDPSEPLTEELQSSIESSALLSILMSPHYLQSDWCNDELNWWLNSADPGGINKKGRAMVSRIFFTEEEWPDSLLDERGHEATQFCFYDKARASIDSPQPYDWPKPTLGETSDAFQKELLRLTRHIYSRLREVKSQLDLQRKLEQNNQKFKQQGGQAIYLHGREQQANDWDKCNQELTEQGYVVFPLQPDPVVSDSEQMNEIREARIKTMSECDLILIVAGDNVMELSEDVIVVGRSDRFSAEEKSKKELPCAVVDKTGFSGTPVQSRAQRLPKLGWIDAQTDPWNPLLPEWIGSYYQV